MDSETAEMDEQILTGNIVSQVLELEKDTGNFSVTMDLFSDISDFDGDDDILVKASQVVEQQVLFQILTNTLEIAALVYSHALNLIMLNVNTRLRPLWI